MTCADPRFFAFTGRLSVQDAAALCGGKVIRDGGEVIETVASLQEGGEGVVAFAERLPDPVPPVSALIVKEGQEKDVPSHVGGVISVRSPKLAFAKVAGHMFRSRSEEQLDGGEEAIVDGSSRVHPTAVLATGVKIAPGVVIGPNSYIGHGVEIGEGTRIGSSVSVTHATIGQRCRILAGAKIGEAGFGYTPGDAGPFAVPQLGAVRLGDEVEVGANTTIDRGTLSDTVIGSLTKIDNLCQIAHNCLIGRGTLIASLSGVSGSCVIGDFVMIGGQVGMADHIRVGDGASLAARAGLMRDVEPGAKVGGAPAKPMRQWMKEVAAVSRLAGGKQ